MDGTEQEEGPDLGRLIMQAAGPEPLSATDAEAAFGEVMAGRATPVQVAALLAALRTRGESPAEVAGGVRALRSVMIPVPAERPDELVDTCGTGGGALTTFNISTAAAFVAAGAGVRIAKHGNRSFSSRCGSADILEALGVRIELTPEQMGEVLEQAGLVFMFAPLLHPAMRHVAPVRRELRMSTIMNVLGPLTNPAGAQRQVVGVANPALLELVAEALLQLGHIHALVVHGEPGLDEISPLGPTRVLEVRHGSIANSIVTPHELAGLNNVSADDLSGADPADNARVVQDILDGSASRSARGAVVLNAAAAIYVGEKAGSLIEGVHLAELAIDQGHARDALERLRDASSAVTASD